MGYFGKAIKDKDLIELFAAYNPVYTDGSELQSKLITVGDDTQYFVDINDDEKMIVVTFQGSHSGTADWINDLNGIERVYTTLDGNVVKGHSGFYNAYYSAQKEIKAATLEAVSNHPDYQVYFFGHSLGAAIAQIAAMDYYQYTGNKAKVITYGTPKVFSDGTIDYVRAVIASVVEVDRSCDIVTYFTPWYANNLAGNKGSYRVGKLDVLKLVNFAYHTTYDDITMYNDTEDNVKSALAELAKNL